MTTDTYAETRMLEGKLDALVNLVTRLAANQKPASVARVCGILSSYYHHTSVCSSSQQSRVDEHPERHMLQTLYTETTTASRDKALDRRRWLTTPSNLRSSDVATNTSAETRKLEGKLDALVTLVTQLAANQKPGSIRRFNGIRSSNDHHISLCPSSQQSGVDEHPEAYAANTYSRPPQ
ncbi:hypothetical protein Fmac_028639 [Flemingia macrophylla]|uniref:Uncharacterized protein n=1 Tax=Flemingia macrophylla TaxID=520843 RepID=A0ABD1L9I5_9FABA